jgi:hypothetical protein
MGVERGGKFEALPANITIMNVKVFDVLEHVLLQLHLRKEPMIAVITDEFSQLGLDFFMRLAVN